MRNHNFSTVKFNGAASTSGFEYVAFSPEMHGRSKSHWRRLDLNLCTWYNTDDLFMIARFFVNLPSFYENVW